MTRYHSDRRNAWIDWERLPKGTYTTTIVGQRFDVWPIGGAWRFSAQDLSTGIYIGGGTKKTFDEACEAALRLGEI